MDSRLLDFTQKALTGGVGRPEIESALRRAGWADADIKAALDAYAEFAFAVPVPRPKPYLSAREVFVYLVLFTALYVTTVSLGALVFELIDWLLPDPMQHAYAVSLGESIRWNISTLIISFPLFIFMFRSVTRSIAVDPATRGSRSRKWLTYLTLFVAGVSLVGDMVALVYNALGGELTLRFVLKVATVWIIAGGVFTYFLSDMRKEEQG
jgi:Domain of unknown function (DUF5671)